VLLSADRMPAASKKALLEIWEGRPQDGPVNAAVCISDNDRMDPADPLEGFAMGDKRACYVYFPEFTQEETLAWARGDLKRRGLEIPPQALDEAAGRYGTQLHLWAGFLNRLDLTATARGRVSLEQARAAIEAQSQEAGAAWMQWETVLLEVFSRRSGPAGLGRLLEAGQNFIEASGETPEYCFLRYLRTAGDRTYEIACLKAAVAPSRAFPYSRWKPALQAAAPRWDWPGLERAYTLLLNGERQLKTGELSGETVWSSWLASFWRLAETG